MPRRTATTYMYAALVISAPLALPVAGCGPSAEDQQRAQMREEFRGSFAHRDPTAGSAQTVSHPKRVVVAQGRSPVVFDVRVPAKAHILDLTAGAELVEVDVGRDQWVSVNEDNGVLVGSRRMLPGPLPAGHEFGIQLETVTDESFQSQSRTDAVPQMLPTRYETTTQPAAPAHPGSH